MKLGIIKNTEIFNTTNLVVLSDSIWNEYFEFIGIEFVSEETYPDSAMISIGSVPKKNVIEL